MIAERVRGVRRFLAMEILERAQAMERDGADIVHLELGEPDFPTPPAILEAGKAALDAGLTHYTHSMGDASLRQAIADHYRQRWHVGISPEQVVVFPGSSAAMAFLFQVLLNPGDEVILSDPCYPCYPNFVRFAGGIPVEVPTVEEEGFLYDPAEVATHISPRTKAIICNSPCNPTGIVMDGGRMRQLAQLGPMIVSDEIYHSLTYGGAEEHSILEFTDNAVVVSGFSKAWAMTGWRLGYLILPPAMAENFQAIMQNFILTTNPAVQRAGITALNECDADVRRAVDIYDERRRFLLDALPQLGFNIPVEPQGAFYMLINARHLAKDSLKLSLDILEKARVGITPGVDFGSGSEGFLRISYANSLQNLKEAVRRLEGYIQKRI